jgi:DNA-binding MarR family transcriptional regulator
MEQTARPRGLQRGTKSAHRAARNELFAGNTSDIAYFQGKRGHDSLGYLVREANKNFSRLLQVLAERHGVTTAQWYFLRALWDQDGISQAELSSRVGLMTPTTVVALNTLEKKGLIRRHRHPTDRRKLNIYLTKKGRQLERQLLRCGKEVNEVAIGQLPTNVVEQTRSVLRSMCENLIIRMGKET